MEVLKYGRPDAKTVKNIFIWTLPALIFLFSGLTKPGLIFNSSNLTFLMTKVLCGIAISVAVAIIRSKNKAGSKTAGVFGCIVLFMIFSFMTVLSPRMMHTCTTVNAREMFLSKASLLYSATFSLPADTGSSNYAEYHTFTYDYHLGESSTAALMCHYEEAGYKTAAANLENSYAFMSNMNTSVGNDRFRVIRTGYESENDWSGKSYMIVMQNDVTHDIAYILLFNPADETCTFPVIIDRYCGWKYIRK